MEKMMQNNKKNKYYYSVDNDGDLYSIESIFDKEDGDYLLAECAEKHHDKYGELFEEQESKAKFFVFNSDKPREFVGDDMELIVKGEVTCCYEPNFYGTVEEK